MGQSSVCSGAEKYCLAHGLGQLTRDVKSDIRTLNIRSDVIFALPRKTPNDVWKWSLCVKCQNVFNFIGKKNNQTLVSDADQEIPTFGSTDNAGNSVNLVSGIILLLSVGISRSASETDVRFYLSHTIMFIHHIVFKMSAKITGWWNINHADLHFLTYKAALSKGGAMSDKLSV